MDALHLGSTRTVRVSPMSLSYGAGFLAFSDRGKAFLGVDPRPGASGDWRPEALAVGAVVSGACTRPGEAAVLDGAGRLLLVQVSWCGSEATGAHGGGSDVLSVAPPPLPLLPFAPRAAAVHSHSGLHVVACGEGRAGGRAGGGCVALVDPASGCIGWVTSLGVGERPISIACVQLAALGATAAIAAGVAQPNVQEEVVAVGIARVAAEPSPLGAAVGVIPTDAAFEVAVYRVMRGADGPTLVQLYRVRRLREHVRARPRECLWWSLRRRRQWMRPRASCALLALVCSSAQVYMSFDVLDAGARWGVAGAHRVLRRQPRACVRAGSPSTDQVLAIQHQSTSSRRGGGIM